jgi:hypothetical protein
MSECLNIFGEMQTSLSFCCNSLPRLPVVSGKVICAGLAENGNPTLSSGGGA